MVEKKLTIYFTSDIHGYIYPTDYRSREERDIGLFKCANRFHKDGNTLVIDGGDVLQGSPFGAFCHDILGSAQTMAQVMNGCGYDYVTLGNHDFNFGQAYQHSYLENLQARCICQNVENSRGEPCYPAKTHVLENGLRIGLVGIVTDHVNVWERPEHLLGITISDPFRAAQLALEQLRDQVDLTICVYHGGFEQDLDTGKVLTASTENIACRICRELDFDILLSGHQHMSVPGQMLNGTFVVQPADSAKEFLKIQVAFDNGEKRFSSLTIQAGGNCDLALAQEFAQVESGAQRWLDEVVGHLEEPFLPSDPLTMASKGCKLADFFNEVQTASSGAQLSATSLANGVAGLPQTVHRRDLLTAYPYTNTLVVLEITGRVLRQAMERSASYFDYDASGALCVSDQFLHPKVEHYNYDHYAGVDYTYDISKPVGQRVVLLEYQGKTVQDDDVFTICLNSYRASGTGGYECYQGCPVVREINSEMSDLMFGYFKEKGNSIRLPVRRFTVQ